MTTVGALTPIIRRATPAEIDTVAAVLAEAFLHGDLAPWLILNVDTREKVYWPYFRLLAEVAQAAGWIDVTDDLAAVALWYPVGDRFDVEFPNYDTRLAQACGQHLHRFVALDQIMHEHHPTGTPHHYLAHLGVHPDRQRQGLGSALLKHHHGQLDAIGMPAYLEATSSRHGVFYRRHGYLPRPGYRLPKGPELYPMWRRPRSAWEAR
ncbi:ribosomal protein S18 acetylase RimI-like enzyme [Couchioplanes caeruleus]|uniref:Ribosomal protein S18 acetylase RimI-like enzyme n=1 Tax=Couchioplanes caeruleus TaxID=56438 RepID=A0A3N1GCZ9_9ACTN|nr:ribosomal protein S18 acetylase RimI-like enzyme [Couchioplanes caeruleus]